MQKLDDPEAEQIAKYLQEKYPQDHEDHQRIREFVLDLWSTFNRDRLADPGFVKELTSGKPGNFEERLTEMALARHLHALGHTLRSCASGPDLRVNAAKTSFWVEVITPAPTGLEAPYLAPELSQRPVVFSVPHESILLRWTSALKEKRDKLEGRDAKGRHVPGYIENEVVRSTDPYVIAINGCRLGPCTTAFYGISQLPHVVEAVLPVGPIAVTISLKTNRRVSSGNTYRGSLTKPSGSAVRTDPFLDDGYAGVSAAIGLHVDAGAALGNPAPIVAVHNPLARNPLPRGVLGVDVEYWAEDKGEMIEIHSAESSAKGRPMP